MYNYKHMIQKGKHYKVKKKIFIRTVGIITGIAIIISSAMIPASAVSKIKSISINTYDKTITIKKGSLHFCDSASFLVYVLLRASAYLTTPTLLKSSAEMSPERIFITSSLRASIFCASVRPSASRSLRALRVS